MCIIQMLVNLFKDVYVKVNVCALHPLGHGGDGFLKFQDAEEVSNVELADAFEQMWQKQRFVHLFL